MSHAMLTNISNSNFLSGAHYLFGSFQKAKEWHHIRETHDIQLHSKTISIRVCSKQKVIFSVFIISFLNFREMNLLLFESNARVFKYTFPNIQQLRKVDYETLRLCLHKITILCGFQLLSPHLPLVTLVSHFYSNWRKLSINRAATSCYWRHGSSWWASGIT